MPKKRALLIGINKYPYLADFSQLSGCHNDVSILKQALEKKFGFEPSDIRVMKSEKATRVEILNAMVSLAEDSEQDDTVIFYFSGHGSRMKANDRVKTSGWYETIMPYDSGRVRFHSEAVNRDITDDEIYDWLTLLGEKTSNIVLIFDSCFASSIIRNEVLPGRKSGVAPSSETPKEPRFVFNKKGKANKGGKKKGRSGWLPLSEKYVFFSAAREYQPANICKLEDGEQYSIFTYHLCEALREAREGDTYHDVWEQTSVMVKSRFEDQDPELEGKRNRKLFGLDEFVPFSFLPVGKRLDEKVLLSGGELHGVAKDSRWAIYPAGTKLIEPGKNNALGKIKVVSTDGLTSEAVLLDEIESGAIREGQRAVEISFPKEKSLRVWVENGVPEFAREIEKLKENVDYSWILESAGEEDRADVKIRLQNVIQKKSSKSGRTTAAPAWLVYGPEDRLLMSPRPASPAEIPGIIEDLERIARYRRTLGLRNPNSILRDKVDFSILRQNDDLTWSEVEHSEDDSHAIIYEADRLALRIVNCFESPIYYSILDLGLSKKVSLLYPPPGAREMIGPSGKQVSNAGEITEGAGILTVGQRDEEGHFEISFPKDFPFILSGTTDTGVVKEGVEIYKLFVTTRPHDLSVLEQEGVRDERVAENDIESLIFSVFRGDKEFGEETLHENKSEWTTIEKSFLLRARP